MTGSRQSLGQETLSCLLKLTRALLPVAATCLMACASPSQKDELTPLRERVAELEATQLRLLEQSRRRQGKDPTLANVVPVAGQSTAKTSDMQETAERLSQLEAEISSTLKDYNKRPRKLFPGVRAFAAERIAYEKVLIEKLEHVGTMNYPPEARGKIYGSLVMSMTIDQQGKLVEAAVERSSGQKVLDDGAIRIARQAAPYPPLPEKIRDAYDQLVVIRIWSFTRGTLETVE